MTTTFKDELIKLDACKDAIEWVGDKSVAEAWSECKRSDWMLWFLAKADIKVPDKSLRLIAVRCAREVQHLMKDQRSIDALDVAERHANGEATDEELTAAWAAADAAARDAADAAAWDAAGAAARAAAGDAAWDAAGAAAWAAARAAAGAKQADIIREFIPTL
jgi:hypothetical protein